MQASTCQRGPAAHASAACKTQPSPAATERDDNSENVPPKQQPDDHDRARFGFKKRSAQQSQHNAQDLLQTPSPVKSGVERSASAVEVGERGQRPATAAAEPLVSPAAGLAAGIEQCMEQLGSSFGDPQDLLPLLNTKLITDKLDYKSRMAELTDFNGKLKDALREEGRRRRAAREAIVAAQAEFAQQIQRVDSDAGVQRAATERLRVELGSSRREAEERGRKARQLQELVQEAEKKRKALREEEERLRQKIALEVRRAEGAEAQAFSLRHDLEEARKDAEACRAQETSAKEVAAEAVREAEAAKANCERQLREQSAACADTLREAQAEAARQLADGAWQRQRQADEAQQQREQLRAELQAEFAAQLQDKEKAAAHARAAAEAEAAEREQAVEQERSALQAQLREKDKAAAEQRASFLRELKEKDEAAAEERAALQAQIQEGQKSAADVRAEFFAQLQEKDDRAARDRTSQQAYFQAQLREKDAAAAQSTAGFEAEREQLKGAAADAQQALQAAREQVLELQSECCSEREARAQLEADGAMLKVQLDSAHARLEELQKGKAEVAASSGSLQLQLSSAQADLEEAKKARSSLAVEISSLQTQLSTKSSELEEERRLRAHLEDNAGIAKGQFSAAQQELSEARKAKAAAKQNAEALQLELCALRSELEGAQAAGAARAADVASLQTQLTAVRAEVSEAMGVVGEEIGAKATLVESLQDLRAQLAAAVGEARAARVDLEGEKKARAEEVAGLQSQLAAKVDEAKALTQDLRMLEVEFRSYKEHNGTSNAQQMEAISDLKMTVEKLSQQYEQTLTDLAAQHNDSLQKQSHISSLERRVADAEAQRRQLHNTIQELKGNIRVMCRVRPAPDAEHAVAFPEPGRVALRHGGEAHTFSFDRVFNLSSTQVEVFDEISGLVQSALDGYKVSIFAYGQTGSGKTFTMQGTTDPSLWGLIPRSLSKIFETSRIMAAEGWTWSLEASFLEVYNESLRDLLRDGSCSGSPALAIQHSELWGATVTNALRVGVDSMEQIGALMSKAAKQRAVGATDMNSQSSRSHSVFTLYLRGLNQCLGEQLHGALHLVDLAGSERLDKSGAEGDRLRETKNINRSLSCLTDVFVAKSEGRGHVPFRNSKLTHLMEPCLSGHGKTLMLVNVRPEESNAHETLCALRFAARVSQCNTGGKPKRNAAALPGTSAGAAAEPTSSEALRSRTPATSRPGAPGIVGLSGIAAGYGGGAGLGVVGAAQPAPLSARHARHATPLSAPRSTR